ncbi:MAG: tyrosine-type recombinase/integrase [Candidatus Sulfotelmatobacter sp.]
MTARRDIGTGTLFQHKGCKRWVIQYYRDGRRIREATGQTSKRKAQDLLTERLGAVSRGEWAAPRKPARVEELYRALEDYTKVNRPRGLRELSWRWGVKDAKHPERWIGHLAPVFAHILASGVTSESLTRYARTRQEEGAANATINREFATLRRMFNLARRSSPPKVRDVPHFPMLKEDNVRRGFVEDADFDRLAAQATEPWLRTFLEVSFTYGWRRGELLGLRVRQLNFPARTIRLDAGTTKNRDGREVTMTARVFELLRAATAGKGPDDAVLTREGGAPVRDIRNAWQSLCERAGLGRFVCRACGQAVPGGGTCRSQLPDEKQCGAGRPAYRGLIPHDMRRSAAKALRAAGVPESVIMATGGWRTPSMLRRYAIVSSADQRAAVEMLERARAEKAVSPNPALIAVESAPAGATSANRKVQ